MEEYSELMKQTKIAFAPNGYVSNETFRYFEAAKAGCVILAEERYDYWYYKDAPHITITDWSSVPEVIDNLLSNPEEMEYIREKTLKWWEDNCSPKAVASYIMENVNEKVKN